jgi:hypothetical protein
MASKDTVPIDPAEVTKAYEFCVSIIDNPPEEYRIVKQAVLGLIHLSSRRPELRQKALPYILKVIQDPITYRSNPRRYAVQSLGSVTYYDSAMIEPAIQLLVQLVRKHTETSQYVRKAAFIALSRIARRYPAFQSIILPPFEWALRNPGTRDSVKWGVVIGLGKICQTNAQLRSKFCDEAMFYCTHQAFRMRWAGIKALGHMCCCLGETQPDESLEERVFDIACDLLQHGGSHAVLREWYGDRGVHGSRNLIAAEEKWVYPSKPSWNSNLSGTGTSTTSTTSNPPNNSNNSDSSNSSILASSNTINTQTHTDNDKLQATHSDSKADTTTTTGENKTSNPSDSSSSQSASTASETTNSSASSSVDKQTKYKRWTTPGVLSDEQWKVEDVYLVQYAATQSLALLLRSNPNKWWGRISVEFGKLLLNPKVAAMSKAMVMITYGKIACFMAKDSHFYTAIKTLLFELCSNENILVSEPATYGLVNFALGHRELLPEVKALVLAKLGGSLENAQPIKLQYYLKTWCKLVVKDFSPMLNPRTTVISDQDQLDAQQHEIASFKQSLFSSDAENDDSWRANWKSTERVLTNLPTAKRTANDRSAFETLCLGYSSAVLESLELLLTDTTILDDRSFLKNLKELIQKYIARSGDQEKKADSSADEGKREAMKPHIEAIWCLDPHLKEAAISMLLQPGNLDDEIWLSNFKLYLFNSEPARASSNSLQKEIELAQSHSTENPSNPFGSHFYDSYSTSGTTELLKQQLAHLMDLAKRTSLGGDQTPSITLLASDPRTSFSSTTNADSRAPQYRQTGPGTSLGALDSFSSSAHSGPPPRSYGSYPPQKGGHASESMDAYQPPAPHGSSAPREYLPQPPPQSHYNAPQPHYNAPQPHYNAPPPHYNAPQPYGHPPPAAYAPNPNPNPSAYPPPPPPSGYGYAPPNAHPSHPLPAHPLPPNNAFVPPNRRSSPSIPHGAPYPPQSGPYPPHSAPPQAPYYSGRNEVHPSAAAPQGGPQHWGPPPQHTPQHAPQFLPPNPMNAYPPPYPPQPQGPPSSSNYPPPPGHYQPPPYAYPPPQHGHGQAHAQPPPTHYAGQQAQPYNSGKRRYESEDDYPNPKRGRYR